ncbi:DUF6782 family putative metallopeptidase [Azospirillum sp. sgz301742]
MSDEHDSAEHKRLMAALAKTPTGRKLIGRTKAAGLQVKVAPLKPNLEGEFEPAKRCVLLSDALSDPARIAVFAHELRHVEQGRSDILDLLERTPPLDSLIAGRAIEADAEAVSHLICWELRQSDPEPWVYLSGHWKNSDIAAAVAAAASAISSGGSRAKVLQAAFRTYANVSDRLTGCDHQRVEHGWLLTKRCQVTPETRPGATRMEQIDFAWRTFVRNRSAAWRLPDRGQAVLRMLARLGVGPEPYLTEAEMADALRLDFRGGAQYCLHALEVSVFGASVSRLALQDPRPSARSHLARIAVAMNPVIARIAGHGSGLAATLAAMVAAHTGGGLCAATAGALSDEFWAAVRAAHDAVDERYWRGALADPSRLALMDALEAAAELADGLRMMGEAAPDTAF